MIYKLVMATALFVLVFTGHLYAPYDKIFLVIVLAILWGLSTKADDTHT